MIQLPSGKSSQWVKQKDTVGGRGSEEMGRVQSIFLKSSL
jgi:hypothetical protein